MGGDNRWGPRRLVSLVPSTTESVCAFGARDRLVGCTRYCTHPVGVLDGVERLGGTKNPDRESVLALAPDLVLGNAEENRPEDLAWLQQRVPVLVQTPRRIGEAVQGLAELAAVLGTGEACAAAVAQQVDAALRRVEQGRVGPRVYYAIWRKPWMSVSADTFVHDVLAQAGARNVCADEPARYPEVSPAVAVARAVDRVLLASEPWAFDEAQRAELAQRGEFGDARLVLCDGRDFCWHGVHMAIGLPRAFALLSA